MIIISQLKMQVGFCAIKFTFLRISRLYKRIDKCHKGAQFKINSVRTLQSSMPMFLQNMHIVNQDKLTVLCISRNVTDFSFTYVNYNKQAFELEYTHHRNLVINLYKYHSSVQLIDLNLCV